MGIDLRQRISWKKCKNRWLYLDQNTDSKKFLLFLMEMYHTQLTGNDTEKFSKAAAASIPTIFQDLDEEGQKVVNEYIDERNTENADKLVDLCQLQGYSSDESEDNVNDVIHPVNGIIQVANKLR